MWEKFFFLRIEIRPCYENVCVWMRIANFNLLRCGKKVLFYKITINNFKKKKRKANHYYRKKWFYLFSYLFNYFTLCTFIINLISLCFLQICKICCIFFVFLIFPFLIDFENHHRLNGTSYAAHSLIVMLYYWK